MSCSLFEATEAKIQDETFKASSAKTFWPHKWRILLFDAASAGRYSLKSSQLSSTRSTRLGKLVQSYFVQHSDQYYYTESSIHLVRLHVDFDAIITTNGSPSALVVQDTAGTVPGRDQTKIQPSNEPHQPAASNILKRQGQPLGDEYEIRRLRQEKLQEEKAQKEERDRIRRLIEQDKAQRRLEREERAKKSNPNPSPAHLPATSAMILTPAQPHGHAEDNKADLEKMRLRLRILDTGETLDKTFPTDAKLSDVVDALQKETSLLGGVESFTSQAGFPRKVWKEAEFGSVTLRQAGLGRSAALIVKRKSSGEASG